MRRSVRPARAAVGIEHDGVGELEADQRLGAVEEAGDEQPRAGLTVGHGPAVLVDVLDDRHVLEQVDAGVVLALRAPQAFGRAVQVEGPHAERLLDARGHHWGAQLAAG
jgi:hypothetical protein